MIRPDFEPGSDFFESLPRFSARTSGRRLTIGPFSVEIQDLPPDVVRPLERRYLGFLSDEAVPGDLRLAVRRANVPCFLSRVGDSRGWYQLRGRRDGGRSFLFAHNFAGWFEPSQERGILALCQAGWPGMQVPLENFLRVYYAWRAADRQGFLVHAASIVRGGRAYVFFGHSGAGKTALATRSRSDGLVLSDDLTLVTPETDGYRAHSVPFRGRFRGRIVSERRTYPVAGMFHLARARRNRVTPLPHVESAASLLSCLPFVTDRMFAADPARVMALCSRAAKELPTFRLEYRTSGGLWEQVLGACGQDAGEAAAE